MESLNLKGVFFVSGVDTDCGKTHVTAQIAARLHSDGVRVITQKPVQTGCTSVADDLAVHRKAMGSGWLPEDVAGLTCSYLFKKPASPHLAAQLEDVQIDPSKILADTRKLAECYDVVLVEGAGGLMVPLTPDLMTVDFVAQAHLPLILVTTSHLGGINHAALSIEACKHHGVNLQYVVFNRFVSDDTVLSDDALCMISRIAKDCFPDCQIVVS